MPLVMPFYLTRGELHSKVGLKTNGASSLRIADVTKTTRFVNAFNEEGCARKNRSVVETMVFADWQGNALGSRGGHAMPQRTGVEKPVMRNSFKVDLNVKVSDHLSTAWAHAGGIHIAARPHYTVHKLMTLPH